MKNATIITAVFLLSISFISRQAALADEPVPVTKVKIRIEPSLFYGFGSANNKVGSTIDGRDVNISGGGGCGYGITGGYCGSGALDVDLTVDSQNSVLIPKLDNGSGDFRRTGVLLTAKYKLPLKKSYQHIKFGAGAGYYFPNALAIDLTPAGMSKQEVSYNGSAGVHFTLDFENYFGKSSSWSVGMRYNMVEYKANKFVNNSVTLPVDLLKDQYRNLSGDGLDFIFALMF